MSQRFFEGEKHAKLYALFRPSPPQQLADRIVDYLKEKYEGDLIQCLDVGCGNGQCSALFASHFEKVLGTDVSPAQIEAAKMLQYPPNVEFRTCPAEEIPAGPGSVQIVNASTAAHWFDLPTFFNETDRVLCSGGVVALSCYSADSFVFVHSTKSAELQEELLKFYKINLSPFYGDATKGIQLTLNAYADINLPYKEFIREYVWAEPKSMTLSGLASFLQTSSPFQNMCKRKGEEAGSQLIKEFIANFQRILETTSEPESIELTMKIKYHLLMGRKE